MGMSESEINKGDEFMTLRRKNKQTLSKEKSNLPKEGAVMNTTLIIYFSTLISIGGLLIGFLFGWFANAYVDSYLESKSQVSLTPHPEMLDDDGNMIPFQTAKLISVHFEPTDEFDLDPFEDEDI
jgi:cytoskeletal protein RodZ